MSLCVFFLLSSLLKSSAVSVVFDFNDSLSDVAPVSPISLPVDMMRNGKSYLLMDVSCLSSFIFTPQIECSDCCAGLQRFTT